MAELFNPTFTGDKKLFFLALKAALSGFHDFEDKKNILPIVYEILAEKLTEVDIAIAASKNDNYTSVVIKDELIVRSKDIGDKLINESAFKIDRIGLTSSTQRYSERQFLEAETKSILLTRIPSDFTNIEIAHLNDKASKQIINVITFNKATNTINISGLVQNGLYQISYTTTGDLFYTVERKTFLSTPVTQIKLEFPRILFGSEKIFPINEIAFVRDQDYVVNYNDGIVDFLNESSIVNKEIVFEYSYRLDLIKDVFLRSHIAVVNEIANLDLNDEFLMRVRNNDLQDVTLLQNITTDETYYPIGMSGNEVRFSGINPPKKIEGEDNVVIQSKTLDFGKDRNRIVADITYPENITPLNHPLVSVNQLIAETKDVRLTSANEIITGRKSTVYRRIREDKSLEIDTTSVFLDFNPVSFAEVEIYQKDDTTETNVITPISYNSITREFTFTSILETDDYVVKYDTLQWLMYIGKDVSSITIKTGGVLLRTSINHLIETTDYLTSLDNLETMRLTFTLSGAEKIKNFSSFYTFTRKIATFNDPTLINDEKYQFSYHEFLKNELVIFTDDSLDLVDLIKLTRFRDKGQLADVIINPEVKVYSLEGIEYTENIDYIINFITKKIKRINDSSILPNETVKVFYIDEGITLANITLISEVIQIDYEYGDNTVDHSLVIVDTPYTQLEVLKQGTVQIILDVYPADWEKIEITNTLYSEYTPMIPNAFDPNNKILSFESIPVDGTYNFTYTKREQTINEGTPYYVTYRYGARRDSLQDFFGYTLNLDIKEIERQDEFLLGSDVTTQSLDYQPIDFTRIKIYDRDDQTKEPVTVVRDYDFITNIVRFDPIIDAGAYVFEYYTFRRDVEQLRAGIIGLMTSLPNVPKQLAFEQLIKEFTETPPEIINISDDRFKIGRKILLTKNVIVGDTFINVTTAEDLPASGVVTFYDETLEEITYSFITSGKLQGVPTLGFGAITSTHKVGTRITIAEDIISEKLNPVPAKEAPDLSDNTRAIRFVSSKWETGLLTETERKAWVNYKAINNINIEEGTISFWTGIRFDGDDEKTHYFLDIGRSNQYKNRMSIYKNNKGYLNFEIRNSESKLMSVRVNVNRRVENELISLSVGQTEVELSKVPSFSIVDENNNGITELFESPETEFILGLPDGYGGIIPGTQITVYRWDRETNRLIIKPITVASTYFASYIIGFVNFDETEHFIEATWKTHVRDGLSPRMKIFIDGKKYEPVVL